MKHLKTSLSILIFLCISISANAQKNQKVDSDQQFIDYLENTLANGVVNNETKQEFNERTWSYWHEHQLDYNLRPKKYKKAIGLFYQNKTKFIGKGSRDINRFAKAIGKFHHFEDRNKLAENPVLFIGSSSIAGWKTAISFPELPVINRGLGGISLPEIIHYYNDLLKKYSPSVLVVYCDIDVENGKLPNQAVDNFKTLVTKVKTDFPNTQIILMAMKPTLIDDFLGKDIRKNKIITNEQLLAYCKLDENTHFVDITSPMIKPDGSLRSDIFVPDGMHLNDLGYSLWNPIIKKQIMSLNK